MKKIKELSKQIKEELHDAEKYAWCYAMSEDEADKELYKRLANEELGHADRLHERAEQLIKAYTGEVPAEMQAIWNWEHEQMVEERAEIKALLA